MKVFWSWQSDLPGKISRFLIRGALNDAVAKLSAPPPIEEPSEQTRREGLHVDQDRQGVSGSPDLVREIQEKIRASGVFVGDITPVSTIPATGDGDTGKPEKRNMNPNVAIELGFALGALSDKQVLMVLNTHYGDRSFMPFDLRGMAGPIEYNLAPEATKAEREKEQKALAGKLANALRPFMDEAGDDEQPIVQTPSTTTPAVFFRPNEVLARFGESWDEQRFDFPGVDGLYLRLIPTVGPATPFSKARLLQAVRNRPLDALDVQSNGMATPNEHGAASVHIDHAAKTLSSLSQVFPSGEIWGLASWVYKRDDMHAYSIEVALRRALASYVAFATNELSLKTPFAIVTGAVGMKDRRLVYGTGLDDSFGPIRDDEFEVTFRINDISAVGVDEAVKKISRHLFLQSGHDRPEVLPGFPGQ